MPFIETNVDELAGISLAKGGSGQLINALVALIEEAGGLVVTNQNVENIEVKNDAVTGVRLAAGQTIACSRGVVASVTPQALVKLTEEHLPPAFVEQANNFQYGPGTFVLHLALSDAADWNAQEARRSFHVHIAPSLDYLTLAYQQSMASLLLVNPICVIGQPTLFDPSRVPKGQHVMWVMVRDVPSEISGGAAGTISGKAWNKEVTDAFAERVLDKIERFSPRFRKKILASNIVNPIELQTLNPNLAGGDLNTESMHLPQSYGKRPIPNYADHVMPIPGLYMCGPSTWTGDGASPGGSFSILMDSTSAYIWA
jgi:phytoene dehydrogenase-like protein